MVKSKSDAHHLFCESLLHTHTHQCCCQFWSEFTGNDLHFQALDLHNPFKVNQMVLLTICECVIKRGEDLILVKTDSGTSEKDQQLLAPLM